MPLVARKITQSWSMSKRFCGWHRPEKCQIQAVPFYRTNAIVPSSTSESVIYWKLLWKVPVVGLPAQHVQTISDRHGVVSSEKYYNTVTKKQSWAESWVYTRHFPICSSIFPMCFFFHGWRYPPSSQQTHLLSPLGLSVLNSFGLVLQLRRCQQMAFLGLTRRNGWCGIPIPSNHQYSIDI